MIAADELVHTIKQIASQNTIEHRPFVYGHVASYDPSTNAVRVLVPSMVDDQTGTPLHSGWLPLGVPQAGSQSGLQVVPFGGATDENPTAGELCLLALNQRGTGVAAVIAMMYTGRQQPPHTALQSGLQPGEVVLRAFGTVVRFHANSDVEVTTGGDGNLLVTTTGEGTTTVKSAQPVVVDCPALHCTGEVVANFGTPAQVGLSTHITTGVNHGTQVSGPPLPGS